MIPRSSQRSGNQRHVCQRAIAECWRRLPSVRSFFSLRLIGANVAKLSWAADQPSFAPLLLLQGLRFVAEVLDLASGQCRRLCAVSSLGTGIEADVSRRSCTSRRIASGRPRLCRRPGSTAEATVARRWDPQMNGTGAGRGSSLALVRVPAIDGAMNFVCQKMASRTRVWKLLSGPNPSHGG